MFMRSIVTKDYELGQMRRRFVYDINEDIVTGSWNAIEINRSIAG